MTSHVVLIGCGDTGHTAAGVLRSGHVFAEMAVAQRRVRRPEICRALSECDPLVLAVRRDGTRFWRDDERLGRLRPDDRLVALDATG